MIRLFLILGIVLSICIYSVYSHNVDSEELLKLNRDGAQIIDVRTLEEVRQGVIKNSFHVDFLDSDFQNIIELLDRSQSYVMVCRSGRRSLAALTLMKTLGFKEVWNYEGGMNRWIDEKRPTAKKVNFLRDTISTVQDTVQKLEIALAERLQKEITTQGVARAMKVCSIHAIPLTQKIREQSKIHSLKRTSLKWRNPLNQPTSEEIAILNNLSSTEGIREYTYSVNFPLIKVYKTLTIKPLCLNCHADKSKLSEEVLATINKLYPEDKATGYSLGDVRGVIKLVTEFSDK